MDDPTKDTIPRSAVEYCLRKETVNTNPDAYEAHGKFIAYMDDPDISQFGHWMHSNGFNCALTAIAGDLDKIPSVTPKPERKTARWIPRGCGCFECGECGERVTLNAYTAEKASDRFKFCYCPHCGARMEEGEESVNR